MGNRHQVAITERLHGGEDPALRVFNNKPLEERKRLIQEQQVWEARLAEIEKALEEAETTMGGPLLPEGKRTEGYLIVR